MTEAIVVKIFRLNDYEWFAGESLDEAISCARGFHPDCDEEDFLDDPAEVDAAGLERLRYLDTNGNVRSFKDQLEKFIATGEPFPCLFATTEI